MDLKDLKFKKRDIEKHFITKYISRDYKKSTDKEQKEIYKHLKQIYPKEEDLNCILLIIGSSSLSGKSNLDQDILFLLGSGSAGKSFTMNLTRESIECYFKELKSNTFSKSYDKIDKILNEYDINPQIRISWINEMKDERIDETLFKSFCEEGELQATKMHRDACFRITHYSKPILMLGILRSSIPDYK
eukprot:gene17211-23717_t